MLFGSGNHDCGPVALHYTNPMLSERAVRDAFLHCTAAWPHAGVSNRDFMISVQYLGLRFLYDTRMATLREVLAIRPRRCVVLLYGHFLPIVRGRILEADPNRFSLDSTVFCSWHFY